MKNLLYLANKTIIQAELEPGDDQYDDNGASRQFISIESGHTLWDAVTSGEYGEITTADSDIID